MDRQQLLEFIATQLSPEVVAAYETMSSLKYPIEDGMSFRAQLKEADAAGNRREALEKALTDLDFPILTPQSGLEKLAARLHGPAPEPPYPLIPHRRRPGSTHEDPDRPEFFDPFADEQYDACGRAASDYYQSLVGRGSNMIEADIRARTRMRACRANMPRGFASSRSCNAVGQAAFAEALVERGLSVGAATDWAAVAARICEQARPEPPRPYDRPDF
jgi:hypothetical protein